jgi:hypothetical protein
MSIAPPASDSVTNRRELEFSNQILKTKQDGTDRRADPDAGAAARLSRPDPPRLSRYPGGSKLHLPVRAPIGRP